MFPKRTCQGLPLDRFVDRICQQLHCYRVKQVSMMGCGKSIWAICSIRALRAPREIPRNRHVVAQVHLLEISALIQRPPCAGHGKRNARIDAGCSDVRLERRILQFSRCFGRCLSRCTGVLVPTMHIVSVFSFWICYVPALKGPAGYGEYFRYLDFLTWSSTW